MGVDLKMEMIAGHVEAFHLGFGDLDVFLAGAGVERAFYLES